jgi:hypothetical protein
MSIDYSTLLTTQQKRDILAARIAQFAQEAYQVSLNKLTATRLENEPELEKITQALALLETAITVHQEELASLPEE